MVWSEYGEDLEANLQSLHTRVQRGTYRAKPSRRVYIPKADGRERPLGVAALEDKIVQGAMTEVLNAIYEADFLGFSYGFRRGRSPHDALDPLAVGLTRGKVNWVLDGLILNVESEPDFPLKFESLDRARATRKKDSIELLNLRRRRDEQGRLIMSASVFVPFGKLEHIEQWIVGYRDKDTRWGRPVLEDLIANIHRVSFAAIEALWTDSVPLPSPDTDGSWEVWIRRGAFDWEDQFLAESKRLRLTVPDRRIQLPEHVVRLVRATRQQLESSLRLLNTLAEIRQPRPCSRPILNMPSPEQREWIDEAKARIVPPSENAPTACLLDSGVNRGYPLLEDLLSEADMFTVDPASGESDHPVQPHGTQMAGIAAYGNLLELFSSATQWRQDHRLESVKLLKNTGEHEPDLYGDVTRQAVALPETKSQRLRSFCLAITAPPQQPDGRPSSWSAALDELVVGFGETEKPLQAPKRLLFVAAGNCNDFIHDYQYPGSVERAPVEDPAQAWNVVTVGAMTEMVTPEELGDESGRNNPLVQDRGGLGPTSRTSMAWLPDGRDWPYKPDVVFEGGNYARRDDGEIWPAPSLRLITTAPQFRTRPLVDFGDTSAAVAAAARLGAILRATYPHFWPETVRGLMVYSARWTPAMLETDPHTGGVAGQVKEVLRKVGWGVPNLSRALRSAENQATIICQNELHPYWLDGSTVKTREWHIHALPWPARVLQEAGNAQVILRVTLSYFVEPNPGSRAQPIRSRFRYPGCALRFEVNNPTETEYAFHSRLNAAIAADEQEGEGASGGGDSRWRSAQWAGESAGLSIRMSGKGTPRTWRGWMRSRCFRSKAGGRRANFRKGTNALTVTTGEFATAS